MGYSTKIWIFWMGIILLVGALVFTGLRWLGHLFKLW